MVEVNYIDIVVASARYSLLAQLWKNVLDNENPGVKL